MPKKSRNVKKAVSVPKRKSTQLPWLSNVLGVVHSKIDQIAGLNSALRNQVCGAIDDALNEVVSDKNFSIEPNQKVNLFLSYLRNDEELVTSYFDKLARSRFVNKVFIDTQSIDAGEDIGQSIELGLEEADAVLLALTRTTAESKWVMTEIQESKNRGKLLIPILLDESLLYDQELRDRLKADRPQILDLLSANCIRAFSMLPCEVVHHSIVSAQKHSGIIGRVTAQSISASYDITGDHFKSMLKMIADTYRTCDSEIADIEQAIRVGEAILLSNRVQNDTSHEVLEFLIKFYLLRNVLNVGSDIETRNTYDNVIKLLFRLIHKKNPLPRKRFSFEPDKAHEQDLELLFRVAQVLIRKNRYVEAFRICQHLCRHPDISIPANMNLRSVITYTALGLAYEIDLYREYYQSKETAVITFEKARQDLTGDSYMDLNLVSRIVQSTKKQFETFGKRQLTDPWNCDNVFGEITIPHSRPTFVGKVDASDTVARVIPSSGDLAEASERFLDQSNAFHNIVYLFTEFAKQVRTSLNMIGFDITTLDAPWLITTMGEVEDFFLHDSGNSVESFYNAQLKRNMRTNYGLQEGATRINTKSWVELDYRTRVRQVIYASLYNSLKNLYRAGLFDGEDMTQPSEEILEKQLRKLYCPPDMDFDEIPWHESSQSDEGSFLRRFQYQSVYIVSELSLFLRCVMPLEALSIKRDNVKPTIEMITAFWHEKIKNPEMLFDRMRQDQMGRDNDGKASAEGESMRESDEEAKLNEKYETCSPQLKLGFQVLYSILATFRKVSYTKGTVQIVKDKISQGTCEKN